MRSIALQLRDIAAMPNWIGWERKPLLSKTGEQQVNQDGTLKWSKVPRSLRGRSVNGGPTGTTQQHAHEWMTYDEASVALARATALTGLGFVFPPEGGIIGIDLDHVLDANGNPEQWAVDIVKQLDSYTEWSPSRTGIHILCRGALPKDSTGHPRTGGRRGSIECYAVGRYFTWSGEGFYGFGEKPLRDVTEREISNFWTTYILATPAKAVPMPTTIAPSDILDRMFASANGSKLRALWQGDDTQYEGDASRADAALAEAVAFFANGDRHELAEVLRQAPRRREKWDIKHYGTGETYLDRLIDKAVEWHRAGAASRGSIVRAASMTVADDAYVVVPMIEAKRPDAPWEVNLPASVLDAAGVIGDITRRVTDHTEADPNAIFIGLLTTFGITIGLSGYLEIGGTIHHARTHTLIIGRTSEGRKGESFGVIASVFARALGNDWDEVVITGLSSGEGLVAAVSDDVIGTGRDKRRLVFEAEFARTLRVSRREANTLSTILRQAWDTTTMSVMTRTAVRATDVHLGVMGHITPTELAAETEALDQTNGLLNRFLHVYAHRRVLRPSCRLSDADLTEMVEYFGEIIRSVRNRRKPIHRSPDAEALWDRLYESLNAGPVAAMEARASPMIARLSLMIALSTQAAEIEVSHLQAAVEVWWYAVQSVEQVYGRRSVSTGDAIADVILEEMRDQALIEGGRPVLTQTDLHQMIGRNGPRGSMSRALRLLSEAGKLERVRSGADAKATAARGRPSVQWRITDAGMDTTPPAPRWLDVSRRGVI